VVGVVKTLIVVISFFIAVWVILMGLEFISTFMVRAPLFGLIGAILFIVVVTKGTHWLVGHCHRAVDAGLPRAKK